MTAILGIFTGQPVPFGPGGEPSAIAKLRREGLVRVGLLGLEGDDQADKANHGGPDMAVHHYAFDHYAAFAAELPGLAPQLEAPGMFGENIASTGLTEQGLCIGDRLRLGSALVEISQPRQPCWKLAHKLGVPQMVAAVVRSGRCGWYYRVLEEGEVETGDTISLLDRSNPDWTLSRVFDLMVARRSKADRLHLHALAQVGQLTLGWRQMALELATH